MPPGTIGLDGMELTAALFARFASHQDESIGSKVDAAQCNRFGGPAVRSAAGGGAG